MRLTVTRILVTLKVNNHDRAHAPRLQIRLNVCVYLCQYHQNPKLEKLMYGVIRDSGLHARRGLVCLKILIVNGV